MRSASRYIHSSYYSATNCDLNFVIVGLWLALVPRFSYVIGRNSHVLRGIPAYISAAVNFCRSTPNDQSSEHMINRNPLSTGDITSMSVLLIVGPKCTGPRPMLAATW